MTDCVETAAVWVVTAVNGSVVAGPDGVVDSDVTSAVGDPGDEASGLVN